MTNAQPIAFSVAEAAAATSLSRSTLYKLAREGRLRIRKVAGRSLIARSDILDLLNLQ